MSVLLFLIQRAVSVVLCAACMAGGAQAAVEVTVVVDMRAEIESAQFDPARDALGIRGNQAPLSWERSALAHPIGLGRYEFDLRFERPPFGGQPVQYKFRVERPGQGPDEGWESDRNRTLLLNGPQVRVARAFNEPTAPIPPRRTGRIDRLGIVPSRHVAPRAVQAWLPPSYEQEPSRRYPVLYLQDGQSIFDDEATGAEWQVDETAQRLAEGREIDPPIIVAVDSGRDRIAEYTPTRALLGPDRTGNGRSELAGGGAPGYARFLIEDLKPLIDRRYRTRVDAGSTAVGGSSLGGLVSLWLAVHHPRTFGTALVVSPSVWWDDEFARRDVLALPMDTSRPRLWLDIGTHEGDEAIPAVRRLRDALLARGWSSPTLSYHEDPEGAHDEVSWAARVEGMLRFVYPVEKGRNE